MMIMMIYDSEYGSYIEGQVWGESFIGFHLRGYFVDWFKTKSKELALMIHTLDCEN